MEDTSRHRRVVTSLFASVTALAIQYFADKSLASILIGLAAAAVFIFSKCWAAK
jgi:hypothetical protein